MQVNSNILVTKSENTFSASNLKKVVKFALKVSLVAIAAIGSGVGVVAVGFYFGAASVATLPLSLGVGLGIAVLGLAIMIGYAGTKKRNGTPSNNILQQSNPKLHSGIIEPGTLVKQEVVLPLIPKDGIKMSLINPKGNTCWWNTILNILASTTIYDSLFDVKFNPSADKNSKGLEEFRLKLKCMVTKMRLAKAGETVDKQEYLALLSALEIVLERKITRSDAHAVLSNILIKFDITSKREFDPSKDVDKLIPDEFKSFYYKKVKVNDNGKIVSTTVSPLVNCEASREPINLSSGISPKDGDISSTLPVYLPDNLLILISTLQDIRPQILKNDQGGITLIEYDLHSLKPAFECHYEIRGFKPYCKGHAYYIEYTPSGEFIRHDDHNVGQLSQKDAENELQHADMLILKLKEKIRL